MTKTTLALLLLLGPTHWLSAQYRLLVAGNTADAEPAFYQALSERLSSLDEPHAVLLVGDYIPECSPEMLDYDPEEDNGDAIFPTVVPLLNLIMAHPEVDFYLLPGDRDWNASRSRGLRCVKRLETYLEYQALPNLRWPIRNGCPGPETVDLSDRLTLLMISTQWWNHPHDKPRPTDVDCPSADSEIVIDELLSRLRENTDRNVVLAGHYPPASQGRRGGEFPTRDHFLPPLWGSLALSWKQQPGTPEELSNPRMEPLARAFRNNNRRYSGMFFVGGQDRSQQLLRIRNNHIVNAGAAGPGRWVASHDPAIHVSRAAGFTEMVFAADGAVTYEYRTVADPQNPAFRQELYTAPCERATGSAPPNPAYGPCELSEDRLAAMCVTSPEDSITLPPGKGYERGFLGRLLLGKHYRDAWTTPATVPLRTATELRGGLTPQRAGGGGQTRNLRFKAPDGRRFVFRSVDKNPRRSLDFELRNTVVGDVVEDQTTIGHPFGPLVVPGLMDSLDILHVDSELLLLDNCEALGNFNVGFGGTLGTLEEVPRGENRTDGFSGTFGAEKVHKSYEAFRLRYDDQEVRFAHEEFLRARLFDLLIGDWDRGEDNWRWAQFREDGIKVLRPVPRDRDNAFSLIDGAGPRFAATVFLSRLEHFGFDKPDAGSLSHLSRHLDRFILSPLGREDYQREATNIQEALADEIIEAAVARMPAETYAQSGPEIVAKLKARRDEIHAFAEDLYDRYAETVDIVGTNDEEAFTVHTHENGHLTVTVTDVKGRSAGKVLYQRTFLPWETREVRLYGLGDDDHFELVGQREGPINIRLIGGQGKDEFRSAVKGKGGTVRIYEKSAVADGAAPEGTKFVRSYRDYLYRYGRTAHEFNKMRPSFGASFSGFNGLSLGVGLRYTRYNYVHRDYAARYKLYVESNIQGNYLVELTADFNDVWRKWGVTAYTHYGVPDFYNFFFGLGNNSVFNREEVDRNVFHLVRLRNVRGELGVRRPFAGRSLVSLTGGYQYNQPEETEGTILATGDFFGEEILSYAFLRPEVTLDLRDDAKLPTRGILLSGSHKQAYRDGGNRFSVTRLGAETHLTPRSLPVTLSIKGGYARSSGRVPFYELPSLGRDNGLRGYQRRRWTGDGYVFLNTELRSPVTKIRSRFIPLQLGVRAFYDRGKLLMDRETDEPLRDSYGFGIYVVPISSAYTLSAMAGFSEEESPVLRFSGGVKF